MNPALDDLLHRLGLGVRLIERSLAKVLDSNVQLAFDPEGVSAKVWMPLPLEQH